MAADHTNNNGNGNGSGYGSKLVWWLIGLLGGLVVLSASLIIGRIDGIDARTRDNATIIAGLEQHIKQVDSLTTSTRSEQLARITATAEQSARISALELTQKMMEDRLKTISDRLLAVNQRLDNLPSTRPR